MSSGRGLIRSTVWKASNVVMWSTLVQVNDFAERGWKARGLQ
jgi:hypothetical protein